MKPVEDRFLPFAPDVERVVLGAMMIDSRGADEAMSVISSEDTFFDRANVYVFSAIKQLYTAGKPIDLVTVSQQLRSMGKLDEAGGDRYLVDLSTSISSAAHVEYHARILLQKHIARMVISFSSQIISLAYDPGTDVFDLLSRWQKEFDKVVDVTHVGRTTLTYPAALQRLKESVELLTANRDNEILVGIDTGFARTNRYTGGYRNQDLIILAARPGMGKTAKVLKTAIANVRKGVPVGFISGEMSMEQLTARTVAIDTSFHLNMLTKNGFEKTEYFATLAGHQQRMSQYPLYVDDAGKMDITDVVVTAKTWHRKYDIKLLIIDYIQLMKDRSFRGSNRSDELMEISRRLKQLAKELDIPVIALAQVNRECEKRGSSKRPIPSDIKDCGAIEQDADIIEFIYRPEVYGMELQRDEYRPETAALIDKGANAEIIFAKYRGGAVGCTLLKWIGDKTKFADVDDYNDMNPGDYDVAAGLPVIEAGAAFGDSKSDIPF